jgi:hypothetical protein
VEVMPRTLLKPWPAPRALVDRSSTAGRGARRGERSIRPAERSVRRL